MATIIFDFDDTLFHTDKLKESSRKFFGVTKKQFQESYKQLDTYDFGKHAELINEKHNKHASPSIELFLKKIRKNDFVENNTEAVLETLKKNHTLVLLSKGGEKFQKLKIKFSGLEKYFKGKIHITEIPKEIFLKNKKLPFLNDERIYIINDKYSEIKSLKKEFPQFIYVLFRWPYEKKKRTTKDVFKITNLENFFKILNKD